MGFNEDPVTLHKYLYTHANPVMNLDPSGNLAVGYVVALCIGAIILGILAIIFLEMLVDWLAKLEVSILPPPFFTLSILAALLLPILTFLA